MKSAIKKNDDEKMPEKKDENGKSKLKKKSAKAPVKESSEPGLPVTDSNSGYIPFGG